MPSHTEHIRPIAAARRSTGDGRPEPSCVPADVLSPYAADWRVQAEHEDDPEARCLHYATALLCGEVLTPQQLDELAGFLFLTRYANVVVDYDADGGFAFRPFDPAVDAPETVVRKG